MGWNVSPLVTYHKFLKHCSEQFSFVPPLPIAILILVYSQSFLFMFICNLDCGLLRRELGVEGEGVVT